MPNLTYNYIYERGIGCFGRKQHGGFGLFFANLPRFSLDSGAGALYNECNIIKEVRS